MTDKSQILVAIRPALYADLFGGDSDRRLRQVGELHFAAGDSNLTSADLANVIGGFDIVVTGWGAPKFTPEVLAAADKLRLIVHSAGTIKRLLPPPVFAAGRRVTHVAAALAPPVGEMTLLLIMLSLRRLSEIDAAFRDSGWHAARQFLIGQEIAGKRIGIIGASQTGREAIRRLLAMDAQIWLYDPYVDAAAANALGATKVDLETLMRQCPVVSLQAPATDETYHMIGARELSWLQDGAVFVNTSRGHLIDEAALAAELKTGRFIAALDVFQQEPLPDDSPLRGLPNVLLTPHISSHTEQARKRQGQFAVDEIERFLAAGELRYEVTRDMLDTMA